MESFASDGLNRLISGRYRLIEPVGHGGMATVYRGQDEVLGRDIAVKLFRASAVAPDDIGRQETEMRLLASLSHPGLVTLFDAGKDDAGRDDGEAGEPRAFLVMELIDGPDLRKRLREPEPLSHADVAYIGAELAGALAYIHSRGVIHRDVKPANILLPPMISGTLPRAKLTDFGIARMLDGARITATNATLGTANYLSPEQASSQEVGLSSDIYSLGLVLLEAATGHIEFGGSAVEAAIARLSRSPEIPDELGHYWCSLLKSMTDRDPEQRPNAAEVSAALLEYRWSSFAAPGSLLVSPDGNIAGTADGGRWDGGMLEDGMLDGGPPTVGDAAGRGPVVDLRAMSAAAAETAAAVTEIPDTEIPEPEVPEPEKSGAEPQPRQHFTVSGGPSGTLAPPRLPPRTGRLSTVPAASAALAAVPGRPTRLALAGRTLLALIAMAVLAAAVMMVAGRLGIFPSGPGYPAVPGQLGEHLRELQESVTP